MILQLQIRRFFLSIFLLSFSACSGTLYKQLPEPSGLPISGGEKQKICDRIGEKDREIETLRTLLRVKITYGDDVTQLRYAVLLGKNGEVKIEALPPSGAYALAVLLIVDGKATFVDVTQKKVTYSSHPEEVFAKFFEHLPITLEGLTMLIKGRIAKPVCENGETLFISSTFDSFLLTTAKETELLEFTTQDLRPERIFFFESPGDDPSVLGSVQAWSDEAVPNAWKLQIESPAIELIAETLQTKVNTQIRDSLFTVHVPGNYEVL